jgi:hypothetical protein
MSVGGDVGTVTLTATGREYVYGAEPPADGKGFGFDTLVVAAADGSVVNRIDLLALTADGNRIEAEVFNAGALDVNFDGYNDLRVCDRMISSSQPHYAYYVWKNASGVFEFDAALSAYLHCDFDAENKSVSAYREEAGADIYERFEYAGGELVLFEDAVSRWVDFPDTVTRADLTAVVPGIGDLPSLSDSADGCLKLLTRRAFDPETGEATLLSAQYQVLLMGSDAIGGFDADSDKGRAVAALAAE